MSTKVTGTLDDLRRFLDGIPDAINLDENDLGEHLFDLLGALIHERFLRERGPTAAFSQNRGPYGIRKRAHGIPVGIGIGKGGAPSGLMAQLENFLGIREIEPLEAKLGFGADDFSRRKGMWFTNGSRESDDDTERSGADNQPPRPFFDMSQGDLDQLIEALYARFNEYAGGSL